ncbi:MAG: VOC family protein [Tuberibacillus sp.]
MARIRGHQFNSIEEQWSIHHVGFEVSDIDKDLHRFQNKFGFEVEEAWALSDERIAFLRKGKVRIELVQPLSRPANNEFHIGIGVKHLPSILEMFANPKIEPPVTYANGWTSAFMKVTDHFFIEWMEWLPPI